MPRNALVAIRVRQTVAARRDDSMSAKPTHTFCHFISLHSVCTGVQPLPLVNVAMLIRLTSNALRSAADQSVIQIPAATRPFSQVVAQQAW